MLPEERKERSQQLARTGFQAHATTFTVVNAALVAIWAITTAGGYFWPIWPLVGWSVFLCIHAWVTYGRPRA